MRFFVLATDYDGTLAHDGGVDEATLDALRRLRASGRKLMLATGREIPELRSIFPQLDLFDLVVGENGALLYFPDEDREQLLAEAPPEEFLEAVRARGVSPLSVGRVIVATWETESTKILDAIHSTGLELQVIFNKGSLMVLPSGVNKATGVAAALSCLGLSPHNAVAVGDAENDHAFLRYCECGAAVANALPSLKERADIVLNGARGAGVVELIDRLLANDLADSSARFCRHDILLGRLPDGPELRFPAAGHNLLAIDTSAECANRFADIFSERLIRQHYQVCLIRPGGARAPFEDVVILGDAHTIPLVEEVLAVLEKPEGSLVVNVAAISRAERPAWFRRLFTGVEQLRQRTGRPHWIALEDAHEFLCGTLDYANRLVNTILATHQPENLCGTAITAMDAVVITGGGPFDAVRPWSAAASIPDGNNDPKEAWLWRRSRESAPQRFYPAPRR